MDMEQVKNTLTCHGPQLIFPGLPTCARTARPRITLALHSEAAAGLLGQPPQAEPPPR